MEKDRKRKATDEAKASRRASKYAKTNDDSLQARSDYTRHDSGLGVPEVEGGVPQPYLQGLMIDYYRANISVTNDKILELERAMRGQSTSDDITNNIWMTERRKRITSSTTSIVAKRRSTTKAAPLVKHYFTPPFVEM